MNKPYPRTDVKTEYVKLDSGLDLESPALAMYPGSAIMAYNYECSSLGGYRRIDGYERYDGRASPSDAIYTHLVVTLSYSVSVGDTITGSLSGATGIVIYINDDSTEIGVTAVAGTFIVESITMSAITIGSITQTPHEKGFSDGLYNAEALYESAEYYRAFIQKPWGEGSILGVVVLNGETYCFRNDVGSASAKIYKATTGGWTNVPTYYQLSFTGGSAVIADGTTITQLTSGASATVKRQVLESGAYIGSTAAGRLIISDITGTFNATNAIQVGGVTKATASSLATAITIQPNGRYEFVVYNFYGSSDTLRVYGCDGVNKSFEFDGSVYVPINTGMATDTPKHIVAHKRMLFLSFKGSLQNSGVGVPYEWTAITGASEIAVGEDITALKTQPGDVLAVMTRNTTSQLSGSSTLDFKLDVISANTGCVDYGAETVDYTYLLDDRGIIKLTTGQSYGNFDKETISRKVQMETKRIKKLLVCTAAYKTKNQIRFYGSDGTGLIMTVAQSAAQAQPATEEHRYTEFKYPFTITCAWSGESSTGEDVVFLGSSDGWVYQANKGSSFDGDEIESSLILAFNSNKAPNYLKQYRKLLLEMTSYGYSEIQLHPEFSYGDPYISMHRNQDFVIKGVGGYWNTSMFDTIYHYDSQVVYQPELQIAGQGTNISLIMYAKSAIDLGHKLDGVIFQYTTRRLVR